MIIYVLCSETTMFASHLEPNQGGEPCRQTVTNSLIWISGSFSAVRAILSGSKCSSPVNIYRILISSSNIANIYVKNK